MDFTQAHRALGGHREHTTTDAPRSKKCSGDVTATFAGSMDALDSVEEVRA